MRAAALVSRVRGRGRRTRRDEGRGQSSPSQADDWNVKIKFFESGSELQNNENECFGESELKGRKLDMKWF
jgi:hypothetical protein